MGLRREMDSEALENMLAYFNTSPDILFVFDSDLLVIEANKTATDKLQYSREEIKGKSIYQLHPSELRNNLKAVLDIVEDDKLTYCPLPLMTRNGTVLSVETNISGGVWNGVKAVFTVSKDISVKLAAEEIARKSLELLRSSEEKYRRFFENAQDVFYQTDLDGKILEISPSIERYSGYKSRELIGKRIEDIYLQPWDKDELLKILSSKGGIEDYIVKLKMKDGRQVIVSANVQMIYSADGLPVGVEGALRDVTQRYVTEVKLKASETLLRRKNKEYVRLNNELSVAIRKAEESDRLKTAFLANMSHEIRTPMNGIMGFSMLLTDPGLTIDERESYIKIVHSSCDQLLRIINDIIDISKIESGQIDVTEASFDLRQLLSELESFYTESLKGNEVRIIVNRITGVPVSDSTIITDRTKLRQILDNLISNAIKFTSKGSIELRCNLADGYIQFDVEDTGIGIPEEIQEDIFKRFWQAETSLSRSNGGTGLGLSITKAYVELLGGSIWVKSKQGEGSVFSFKIPYKHPPEPAAQALREDFPLFSGIHPLVLVVEDEEVNWLYIQEILKKSATTVRASSATETLELLREHPGINLILMDIKLPDMNGLELTRLIKSMHPDLPVVAQSAYALAGDREKALEAGCSAYITKPLNREVLLDLISSHV